MTTIFAYNKSKVYDKEIEPKLQEISKRMVELGIPHLFYAEPRFDKETGLRSVTTQDTAGRFPSPNMFLLNWATNGEETTMDVIAVGLPEDVRTDVKTSGMIFALAMTLPELASKLVEEIARAREEHSEDQTGDAPTKEKGK
jgi:hypothetical protein